MGQARQIGGLFQYDNCWPTQANDVAMRLGVMKSKHFPSKRIFVFLFRIFDKLSMWNIDSEMPKMVRRWVSLTLIDSHKGKRRCSRSANGINIYFFFHPQRSSSILRSDDISKNIHVESINFPLSKEHQRQKLQFSFIRCNISCSIHFQFLAFIDTMRVEWRVTKGESLTFYPRFSLLLSAR